MKIFQNKFLILFILIVLLAFFLRTYNLASVPSGFHQDEVVNAYVGRFVLLNLVDPYGNFLPFAYFNKLGDFPPILPMYLAGLGTFFFGPSVFGARIVITLLSLLLILPIYKLSFWVFKNSTSALFTIFLYAITPWGIVFSRVGTEGTVAIVFYLYALMLLVYSSQKQKIFYLILSSLLFFLTYFIYPSYRLITPLTLLVAPFLFLPKISNFREIKLLINNKYLLTLSVIVFLSIFLFAFISTTNWGKGRFNQTSIFALSNTLQYKQFLNEGGNILVERVFHNKIEFFNREILKQYLSYFNPNYLFIEGGRPQWFSVPNTGLFYLSYLILLFPILLSFVYSNNGRNINKRLLSFLALILFIAPIPSAITSDNAPQTHRTLLMSVMFLFIFTYGYFLINKVSLVGKILKITFFFLVTIELLFFCNNYFYHENNWTAVNRRDGNIEAVNYITENKKNFANIFVFIDNWFPAYYLYFNNNFEKNLIGRIGINFKINKIENVSFNNIDCPNQTQLNKILNVNIDNQNPSNLIIVRNVCELLNSDKRFNAAFKQVRTIKNINNLDVFYIYTNRE